jgi:hypothetical protein
MYRDDRDAMMIRLNELSRESDRLRSSSSAMREELLQLRRAMSLQPSGNVYKGAPLGPGERLALGAHQLEKFPVWAVALLHVLTLGLFSIIFLGMQHGKLPRAAEDDPTTGTAIGFSFIPAFNLYWMFFSPLRLCDRLTLQYRVRGLEEKGPHGIVLAAAICTVLPVLPFCLVSILVLWCIASCMLQSSINRLVDLGAVEPDPLQLPPA